jgi:hypothetical protein
MIIRCLNCKKELDMVDDDIKYPIKCECGQMYVIRGNLISTDYKIQKHKEHTNGLA